MSAKGRETEGIGFGAGGVAMFGMCESEMSLHRFVAWEGSLAMEGGKKKQLVEELERIKGMNKSWRQVRGSPHSSSHLDPIPKVWDGIEMGGRTWTSSLKIKVKT
jgi:hypothetical protein